MNVLDLIKEDHRRVRELIRRLRHGTESAEASRRLFGGLRNTLERHMDAEEACFYSVIDPEDDDLIDEAAAEHESVYELLSELDRLTPGTSVWREGLDDLDELIEAHVDMEEVEIFALARRTLSLDRLEVLAQDFRALSVPRLAREEGGRQRDRLDPYVRE